MKPLNPYITRFSSNDRIFHSASMFFYLLLLRISNTFIIIPFYAPFYSSLKDESLSAEKELLFYWGVEFVDSLEKDELSTLFYSRWIIININRYTLNEIYISLNINHQWYINIFSFKIKSKIYHDVMLSFPWFLAQIDRRFHSYL